MVVSIEGDTDRVLGLWCPGSISYPCGNSLRYAKVHVMVSAVSKAIIMIIPSRRPIEDSLMVGNIVSKLSVVQHISLAVKHTILTCEC